MCAFEVYGSASQVEHKVAVRFDTTPNGAPRKRSTCFHVGSEYVSPRHLHVIRLEPKACVPINRETSRAKTA